MGQIDDYLNLIEDKKKAIKELKINKKNLQAQISSIDTSIGLYQLGLDKTIQELHQLLIIGGHISSANIDKIKKIVPNLPKV